MTTPINLNKARKAKARAEKTVRAAANSAKFGQSKAVRKAEKEQSDRAARALDGHKRDT